MEHIPHVRYGSSEWDTGAPILPLESHFRHSGWAVRRRKVYEALMRSGQTDRRRCTFADCGAAAFVQVRADGADVRIVANHCKDRFCVPCQTARAAKISAALTEELKKRPVRFVTLTQRASSTSLADQIDALYRDFSTLRRRRWWRDHVTGGAAFMEIKLGANSGLWHVHLHILCEGKFLPQKELSTEWYAVTGASYIVDVRECLDLAGRARYVTKYVTKPASAEVFEQPEKLDEMITAVKGRRLCLTFGAWRGIQLDPDDVDGGEWSGRGSLDQLCALARGGDATAVDLLVAVLRKYPALLDTLALHGFDPGERPPADA